MAKGKGAQKAKEAQKPLAEFHQIKSNFFRVIHADGAFGGVSPNGYIHMSIYSERRALPRLIVHEIEPDSLGKEVGREGRAGMVRELEVDVVLDEGTAIALRQWLGDKIEELQKARGAKDEDSKVK